MDPTTGHSVGRNEPCPCGSGRKYKQCCLDKDETKAREARARAAEKEARAAAKAEVKADKPADKGAGPEPPRPPKKPQTYQPWKRTSATNTQSFQRMSTPRKVGGS